MVTVTEMGTTQPEKEPVRDTITVPHAANYKEVTQLNLDDLFKLKPNVSFQQPRIGEKIFLRKSVGDLEEGNTVTVVHQLSETEFVVYSEDHECHQICHATDFSSIPLDNGAGDYSITDSDRSSDYARDYSEAELCRGNTDLDMSVAAPTLEKPTVNQLPASTPLPPTGVKRKEADTTMASRGDDRRVRRNSLAFYQRRLSKARRKIRTLNRTIASIKELPENSRLNLTTNPADSTLVKSDLGDQSPIDSSDSEDELGDEPSLNLMTTSFVPPSTSHFLNTTQSKKLPAPSKDTEAALKMVRTHPDRVPQKDAYASTPLAFFMCRIIYTFAIRQGLHQVEFLNRWIFYAFPDVNQEKVHYYLGLVQAKFPKAGLFITLRELARKLSPDDFLTMETIQPRAPTEALTDLLIRLQTDIRIVMECTDRELANLVIQFIRNSERSSPMGMEFRRELLKFKNTPNLEQLHEIASRVDRLIQPQSEHSVSELSQIGTTKHICQVCSTEHMHLRDNGQPWPSCESCMFSTKTAADAVKSEIYSSPRQAPRNKVFRRAERQHIPTCRDCGVKSRWNPRSRNYYARCYQCFQKHRTTRNSAPFKPAMTERTPSRTTFSKGSPRRSYADVTRERRYPTRSINKFRVPRHYDPSCYRLVVRVKNRAKTAEITGLFDTGCNVDLISRSACNELGISHLIKPCHHSASVVDGAKVHITGKVYTTVHIGDIPYTKEFDVIENIKEYDMMVGTKFMERTGLLQDILSATQNKLGRENVIKGN